MQGWLAMQGLCPRARVCAAVALRLCHSPPLRTSSCPQPSTEIFESFDMLILMQLGGWLGGLACRWVRDRAGRRSYAEAVLHAAAPTAHCPCSSAPCAQAAGCPTLGGLASNQGS